MDEPTTYEKLHWKLFNIGAKAFGIGLVIISFVFIVLITRSIMGLSGEGDYPAWLLVLFIPLVPLGVLIVRAKNYYPKQFKEYYERDLP